ncbi:MAG: hypothetical protein GY731_09045 [Gammaproteobacteria bacterium]|nr:hypothetical protein [Gammaproteobacteria bacterium]
MTNRETTYSLVSGMYYCLLGSLVAGIVSTILLGGLVLLLSADAGAGETRWSGLPRYTGDRFAAGGRYNRPIPPREEWGVS